MGGIGKQGMSRNISGELNYRKVRFETRGLFKFETNIVDPDSEVITGKVKYKKWNSKSTISYKEREYRWSYDNFLGSKWRITTERGPLVKYHSNFLTGTIVSYTDDEILILTGFYIRNYLKQKSAAIAAAS